MSLVRGMQATRRKAAPEFQLLWLLARTCASGGFNASVFAGAFLLNKYPFLCEIWPFCQAPFDSHLFSELKETISQSVNSFHDPLPLRILLEDVWASVRGGTSCQTRAGMDGRAEAIAPGGMAYRAGTSRAGAQTTDTGLRASTTNDTQVYREGASEANPRQTDGRECAHAREGVHEVELSINVKDKIIQYAREAVQLEGKAKREKLISTWQLAGDQLVGSSPGKERFATFVKEYFNGSALVPPLGDLIYGNTATGKPLWTFSPCIASCLSSLALFLFHGK